MAKWTTLKNAITSVIKTNGKRDITGQAMQNVLTSIVNTIGYNATFAGTAYPNTNPGSPEGPVFYLAYTPGIYTNFNGISVMGGQLTFLYWDGTIWTKSVSINDGMFTDYAQLVNGSMPELDTINGTFKIKSGTLILGRGYNATLSQDLSVGKTAGSGTDYIVFDIDTTTLRAIPTAGKIYLAEKEVVIALIKWADCVYGGNFLKYYLDGRTVYLKPIGDSGSPEVVEDKSFIDYAMLQINPSTYPELNTTNGTFKLKKDSFFLGNGISVQLSKDVVLTKPSDYGSHFVIIDSYGGTRLVKALDKVTLAANEMVVCLLRWGNCILQSNIIKYYLNGTLIDFKSTGSIGQAVAPKMYNPPINLQKEQLRVLDIGNSYTNDCVHYLPQLVNAAGIDASDMCLYKATRGSGSFKNWYDIYYDKDTSSYEISKVLGGLTANISGAAAVGNGEQFRNTLKNNDWDLIIIHQRSEYAPYYDTWETTGEGGYLKELIRAIRTAQPSATIGLLLVHSYWDNFVNNAEKSSLERWKLIAESAKKLSANYGINFIIPYGTAIQNIRESSLNNEYDLTADGSHCSDGLADYTAACAYFQSLFAPRYGVCVLGNTARVTVTQAEQYPSISVTDSNAPIAQKAAILATYDYYTCQNPETAL